MKSSHFFQNLIAVYSAYNSWLTGMVSWAVAQENWLDLQEYTSRRDQTLHAMAIVRNTYVMCKVSAIQSGNKIRVTLIS